MNELYGLPRIQQISDLHNRKLRKDETIEVTVKNIIKDVKLNGIVAVEENGLKFNDITEVAQGSTTHAKIFLQKEELQSAFLSLPLEDQKLLIRVRDRIQKFAIAQKNALQPVSIPTPGGVSGHDILPVKSAGCYAPGGRYPLPSSVLMTVTTARVAGVEAVIVASPKPNQMTKAAAYISDADGLLSVGGSAAIAAMAYGLPPLFNPCDVVVGPGNNYVTEAKRQVNGDVRIDLLAGPSELFIIADSTADPITIATDLIAQAEHDTEASVVLITDSETIAELVNAKLEHLVAELPQPNQSVASKSLSLNSGILVVNDLLGEGVEEVNKAAPEHLQIMVKDPSQIRSLIHNAGAIFEGGGSAEVFGDYGIGPNHTLPTSGASRYRGGLSVYDFLKVRTWVRIDPCYGNNDYKEMVRDCARLAQMEGLYGHVKSAVQRLAPCSTNMELSRRAFGGIIRDDVDQLMKYHSVKSLKSISDEIHMPLEQISKLNANENIYGPATSFASTLCKQIIEEAWKYPDPDQVKLRQRLSKYTGRRIEELTCGAGADDIIQLLIQICRPNGVVVCTPTFAMYDFFARINRSKVHVVPLTEFPNFEVDIEGILSVVNSTPASIVFLGSPNNPTGKTVPHDKISTLCSALEFRALVVIDEAYVEFSDKPSSLAILDMHPNLCVVRTFSKWAGLAGLRCGYCVGHPDLVSRLQQIKIPYNLSIAASIAACYTLDNQDECSKTIELIKSERSHIDLVFQSKFSMDKGIRFVSSDANFFLLKIPNTGGQSAEICYQRLWKRGILTRRYNTPELQDFIRVSIGTPNDTQKFFSAFFDKCFCSNLFMLSKPKPVFLWDIDGVLADVSKSYHACIINTCKHYAVDAITKDDILKMKNEGGFNNDWILTQALIQRFAGLDVPLQSIRNTFDSFYRKCSHLERLIIPVEKLTYLKELSSSMAIVTGRPKCDADEFLDRFKIRHLFDCVVCMEDTNQHKPEPAPLLLALKKIQENFHPNVALSSAIYFGDTKDDIKAAINSNTESNINVVGVGLIPPQIDLSEIITYGKELYLVGAAVVGLRWDCITALGIGLFPPPFQKILTDDDTTIPSTPSNASVERRNVERQATVKRKTKETSVICEINLDGSGQVTSRTGIGFLDHMIDQLGKHGGFDIRLECDGDLHVDDHHTVEDCAIVLGKAFDQALGSRCGIARFGSAYAPLDESLARAVVDLAGRGWAETAIPLTTDKIGGLSCEMVSHFFYSLSCSMRAAIHVDILKGHNSHHKVESSFKALALALKHAVSIVRGNEVPSTKGTL